MLQHDVLVIGAGLAGSAAALEATVQGVDVAIVTKLHPLRSHTVAAMGGINAALAEGDTWEGHAFDTIKGSDYLADQDAVELLTREAPATVIQMDHWGTPFSRDDAGSLEHRPFGGHGMPRAVFAGDRTGLFLMQTMWEQLLKHAITTYEEYMALSLLREDGKIAGVSALNVPTGELLAVGAKAVVLATGPAGQMYSKTTNAATCTGDGIAMAMRAGIPAKDMEFVQFHPTTLHGPNILITEAARGEGGIMYNNTGERFMERYSPKMLDLAPRDIVSRAIQTEVNEGRGLPGGYVHLDLTMLGEDRIKERLPEVYEFSRDFAGVNPAHDPIPIEPGQHYIMGGIATDIHAATPLSGVFAAGECACVNLHGANRLGGNALLECLVFGKYAGRGAAAYAKEANYTPPGEAALATEENLLDRLYRAEGPENPEDLKQELRATMMDNVGVFRTEAQMQKAVADVRAIRKRSENIRMGDKSSPFNFALVEAIELYNLVDLAEVIAVSALARKESRGAHSRTDFPKRDDADWLGHTLATRRGDDLVLTYQPVTITKWQPKERTY